jgi:capsid protein
MSRGIHPLTQEPKNGKPRAQLQTLLADTKPPRRVEATYDAARDSDDFKNYWANADSYDADSANSRAVREKLVPRSRYEIGNNGYADGIAQTYATDVVGTGPALRMQTQSQAFNQMVELRWKQWADAVQLRRKLWTMAHAKYGDGEAFAVLRRNPGIRNPVQLDVRLYETEQCQTPALPFNRQGIEGYIDGIRFDDAGNILWYDFLTRHPGSDLAWADPDAVERVPPEAVLHWFKMTRPGQHRGVPENTSTLNTGAAARRWREATIASAETAADFSVFLKTGFAPDELDPVSPMSTLDIEKRMMTALPAGWDPFQMRGEHPNAQYEAFHKTLINEQARPASMPYNKAACDSSSYNYASGRLDHQTYYAALDVDRSDANDLVLNQLFRVWFDLAVMVYQWFDGQPESVGSQGRAHLWDWPKHRVADIVSEAKANDTKLRNGSIGIAALYSEQGLDFEDELIKMAESYGKTVDEMREALFLTHFPAAAAMVQTNSISEVPDDGEDE